MSEQKFDKQVAKEGPQIANAKYLGLVDEPKTGTGAKGDWRKAKLRFQIEGREKENKFEIWTPLTSEKSKYKSDEELKQFSTYKILWYEKENEFNGKEWVSKTIQIIEDRDDTLEDRQKQAQPITQQTTQPKVDWDKRNQEIELGQAINIAVQLITSDPNYKLKDFNSESVDEITFNATLPMLTRIKKEAQVRRDKLEEALDQLEEANANEGTQ